jgi:hypothetical protein
MTRPLGLCAVLGVGLLGGCGSPYRFVPVGGRVLTCEGKPAAGGTVVFTPVDDPDRTGRPGGQPGRASRGTVAADGTFTLTAVAVRGEAAGGALVGPHRVTYQMPPTERPVLGPNDKAVLLDVGGEAAVKAREAEIAAMVLYPRPPCRDAVTPDEVEVPAAGGQFDFTLRPK